MVEMGRLKGEQSNREIERNCEEDLRVRERKKGNVRREKRKLI